jgi:SIR2-like protein
MAAASGQIAKEVIDHVASWSTPFAVLCGAGISSRAGLPMADQFQALIMTQLFEDPIKDLRVRLEEAPPRYERFLDVIQRIADPQLGCLKAYGCGLVPPKSEHFALAHLAGKHLILTTNFDVLIEEAFKRIGLATRPLFRDVDYSIFEDPSKAIPPGGLWKLHGTVAKYDGSFTPISFDEEGGPVATLRTIGWTREGPGRRKAFSRMAETQPLIVVGYSGADDFDIMRWLIETRSDQPLLWVQWIPPDRVDSGPHAGDTLLGGSPPDGVDKNLVRLAGYWATRPPGQGRDPAKLTVVLSSEPHLLLESLAAHCTGRDIEGVGTSGAEGSTTPRDKPARDKLAAWCSETFSAEWLRLATAGALLAETGFARAALGPLELARKRASGDSVHRCNILYVEAAYNTFDFEIRKAACSVAEAVASELRPIGGCPSRTDPQAVWDVRGRLALARLAQVTQRAKEAHIWLGSILDATDADHESWVTERSAAVIYGRRLVRFVREDKQFAERLDVADAEAKRFGDLQLQMSRQHDKARNQMRGAAKLKEAKAAISEMREALRERELLSDADGICASTILLGNFSQRLLDWLRWEGGSASETDDARKETVAAYERSLEAATQYELRWQEQQARLVLALAHVRLTGCVGLAQQHYAGSASLLDPDDPREGLRLRFLGTLLAVASRSSLCEAARVGADGFASLAVASSSAGEAERRMAAAATLNAVACSRILEQEEMVPGSGTEDALRTIYWCRRRHELDEFANMAVGSVPEFCRALLDGLIP